MTTSSEESSERVSAGQESPSGAGLRRLWAPWRLKYVAQDGPEEGCIFCNRLAAGNDVESLILFRSTSAFLIMNLYPYNTGHIMIVPNRHLPDPRDLEEQELNDMALLLPASLDALRMVLRPAGFNIGMNIDAVAGAGVAEHLHQHIVPRWQGDANFMPIIAGVMVVPELINATYAKLRAEFSRTSPKEMNKSAMLVVINPERAAVLVDAAGSLPTVQPRVSEAVFRTGSDFLASHRIDADLVGWAGPEMATESGPIALAYLAPADATRSSGFTWQSTTEAKTLLPTDVERNALQRALQLDLTVASAPPDSAP